MRGHGEIEKNRDRPFQVRNSELTFEYLVSKSTVAWFILFLDDYVCLMYPSHNLLFSPLPGVNSYFLRLYSP